MMIPWVGSKRLLAPQIINLLPTHICYCEPFAGAGHVFFAHPRSQSECLNDRFGHLITFYRIVRDQPEELFRRLTLLISSRLEYKSFVQRLEAGQWRDAVDRAMMFYYVIRLSFRGIFGNSWSHHRDKPAVRLDSDGLWEGHRRLQGVHIECLPAPECLQAWDSPETLFYLDPPYPMTNTEAGQGLYQCDMTLADHSALADVLFKVQGRWLLSCEDHPLIRDLYAAYNIREIIAPYSLKRRDVTEVLVANYDWPEPGQGGLFD